MIHTLQRIPNTRSHAVIRRVSTAALADRLAKTSGQRQILPEHLVDPPPQRSYVACVDDEIVGWVNSVDTSRRSYCTNMFVSPPQRRKGIGRSLVTRMLKEDRAAGVTEAVLMASQAGAKLYVTVGYRQIGTVLCVRQNGNP